MKVLNRELLEAFAKKHAQAKGALNSWREEASKADWKTPQDIKNRYNSADILGGDRVIFNIKGNHFRLAVKVRYRSGIVLIEWVGTHADYDKQRF